MYLIIEWHDDSKMIWFETSEEAKARKFVGSPCHYVFWRESGKLVREIK